MRDEKTGRYISVGPQLENSSGKNKVVKKRSKNNPLGHNSSFFGFFWFFASVKEVMQR